jgi:hypothetical protein
MSNTPPIQITPTGVVVPSAVDIRTGILADTNQAFGGDLDVVTPSTPQAYLADNLTDNLMDSNAAIANLIAMVDPATSEGRFQDGIGRIYFFDRKGATSSVVQALCTGQPGLVMPAGQLAQDADGNLWISDNPATFDALGQATIQFSCQTKGPIELGIGALTKIAQLFPGWDAITNLAPAIVGSNVESRGAFENRRQESIAKNGRGTVPAIRAEVWGVDGVIDVFAYDNFTNAAILYGATNYSIKPHSIYVAVVGGADSDIAQAIWRKKDGGCDLNGNTSVVVQDTDGYSYPYPEYTITFNRPTPTPVLFAVQIANSTALPSTIIQDVKDAIAETFTGENGAQRARIGGKIFASNFYAAVAQISAAVSIIQIKVGLTTANLDSIDIGIDQYPTIDDADITVTLV